MTPPAQFARQTIRLQFPMDIHWGDDMTVWISKTGDIARTMYLRVTWPSGAPTTVQPSAGTAMIDRVELSYKDQLIERIYGETLYMIGDTRVIANPRGYTPWEDGNGFRPDFTFEV